MPRPWGEVGRVMRRSVALGAILGLILVEGTGLAWANFSTPGAGSAYAKSMVAFPCASPGTITVTSDQDTYVAQAQPDQNFGADPTMTEQSSATNGNRQVLMHFSLPSEPAHCSVTAVTLTMTSGSGPCSAGSTLNVYPITSSWTEGDDTSGSGVTWNTQPGIGALGAQTSVQPSNCGGGSISWSGAGLASAVQAQETGLNDGLEVRDNLQSWSGGTAGNEFNTRESTSSPPKLQVTFG
jgi:hypothetical protein